MEKEFFKNKVVRRIIWSSLFSLVADSTTMPAVFADALPTPHQQMFQAADDTRLLGDVYAAKGNAIHPCVILLHQLGKSRADMVPLIAPLLAEGFTVLNLDMRGHGSSTIKKNASLPYTQFTNADWAQLPADLGTVLRNIKTIPNINEQKVAMVGASIGANASAMAASNAQNVKALVLLSPGLDFHGLQPASAMAGASKPALIVAARDDVYSADSGLKLSKMDKNSSFDLLPQGGHGSRMFVVYPELAKQIATWLHKAMP